MDHTLQKLRRMYRKTRRKPKGLKRLWLRLLNIPHITVIITAVVFVVVVIMWSLLWVFICKWKYSYTFIKKTKTKKTLNVAPERYLKGQFTTD